MTQKQRLLYCLANQQGQGAGWVSCRTLNDICFRYGARIHELRHNGNISIEHKKENGLDLYRLMTNRRSIDFDKCQVLATKETEQTSLSL